MRLSGLVVLVLVLLAGFAFQGHASLDNEHQDENNADHKRNPNISETDTYRDLNTGKAFTFIYDDLNGIYNRSDLLEPDLYVNTRTKDTFWLYDAIRVNNALIRDATGRYRVDPMKVKRDGDTYKVVGVAQ